MSKDRQLHLFVDTFVHTEKTVSEILKERPDLDGPIFEAMRSIVATFCGKDSFQEAIDKAQRVPLEAEDPFLVVIFLFVWGMMSGKMHRLGETAALARRARAMLTSDAPPELEAQVLHLESQAANSIGDKQKVDEIYRRAQEIVPADSPKYPSAVLDYSLFLAQVWRLPEIDQALEAVIRRNPARYIFRAAQSRFAQYAETGQIEKALATLEIIKRDAALRSINAERFHLAIALFGMMRNEPQSTDIMPELMQPLALLLARRPEEALARVRENLAPCLDEYLAASTFPAFNLVRAELACGHGPAAKRIMEIRRRRGNVHPLDDFFLARAEFLCGNREAAAALFARALRTIEIHSAQGRLEFELKMSCELSAADMHWLMRRAMAVTGGADDEAAPTLPVPLPAVAPRAESRGLARMVGPSAAMEAVREAVRRYAPLDAPVLITGETGTGKELVASALHEESPRRARPFLAVNCGAIVETLLETELFGHERGAFTGAARAHRGFFEQAGEGTVLLDEIGEVTPRLQAALLRVLEAGEIRPVGAARARKISCRILAATNSELDAQAEKGLFRKDLLFRLRRLEVRIPPLQDRREDILPLVDHFLSEGRADGRRAALSPELKKELRRRNWPGNVRELKNEVERMRLLGSEKLVYDLADLCPETGPFQSRPSTAGDAAEPQQTHRDPPAEESQKSRIEKALAFSRSPLRRLDRLRDAFRQSPTLTRQEIIGIMGVSHATATHDLAALRAEGFIEKVQPTASPRTHYFRLR